MAVTKESLAYQGKNLSNILGGIANQIQQNKISAAKQQVLEKYQDPSKVFLNPDGSSKSSYEVQQQSFPDYMWLQSNGFENEAKGLEKMFTSYNADLDAKAKNTAFLKLLTPGQQNMFKGSDLNRIDAAQTFKDYTSTLPEPVKPIKPIYQKFGENMYEIIQDADGNVHSRIFANNKDWNLTRRIGESSSTSFSLNPDLEAIYDENDNLIEYRDKKKPLNLKPGEKTAEQVKREDEAKKSKKNKSGQTEYTIPKNPFSK
jgi:hypothetical protein